MKLSSALWFSTWSCPYVCPYCWNRDREAMKHYSPLPEDRDLWAANWADAWNRLNPDILDLTGGEPTALPIVPMAERLNPGIRLAITTNATRPDVIARLAQMWASDRLISWTISYHPTQIKNQDMFWGTVELLKRHKMHVSVNLVGWPEQLHLVSSTKSKCASLGVNFHFDPYAVPVGREAPVYTPEQLEVIRANTGKDRTPEDCGRVVCPAGSSRMVVFPDGSAYRCLRYYHTDRGYLGNVLGSGLQTLPAPSVCEETPMCAGCDRDKVSSHWRKAL